MFLSVLALVCVLKALIVELVANKMLLFEAMTNVFTLNELKRISSGLISVCYVITEVSL